MGRTLAWMVGLALVVMQAGCVTKIRNITAEAITDQGLYVAYWEGSCKPILGCGVGEGKVQFCKLHPSTNGLVCKEQMDVAPLIATK